MIEAAVITMDGVHEPARQVLPRVCNWLRRAKEAGAQIAFFPELILGHFMEETIALDGVEITILRSLARELGISIGIGIGEAVGQRRYSTYVMIDADGDVGTHRKTRGRSKYCPMNLGRRAVTHTLAGFKIGVMLCSECRYPEVAWQIAADGAELLVIPLAYSYLVDPRLADENCRSLNDIFEAEASRRAWETGLATIAVAASGYYERRGKRNLYPYKFESGCALIDENGQFIFRQFCDGVTMQRFQISRNCQSAQTLLNRR
jgi:predicted amidohydrolase